MKAKLNKIGNDRQYEIGHFRRFPNPLFQSEANCEAIYMKMIFFLMQIKVVFTKNGFALSLGLKKRVYGPTKKWSIKGCLFYLP